jgi:hypothetical protein
LRSIVYTTAAAINLQSCARFENGLRGIQMDRAFGPQEMPLIQNFDPKNKKSAKGASYISLGQRPRKPSKPKRE